MTNRQEIVLKDLLETYISQAEPVSSASLAQRINVSSATVRNEFAALEESGYLRQPHTSAGRIPTLKAYEYYVRHALANKPLAAPVKNRLQACLKETEPTKALAKQSADMAHVAVLVSFNSHSHYYTGLSQLFSQPEFGDQQLIMNMARILDVLETVMPELQSLATDDVSVLLGNRNPFGSEVSLFITSVQFEKRKAGICAFLAPLRTDYNRNVSLLQYLHTLIDEQS